MKEKRLLRLLSLQKLTQSDPLRGVQLDCYPCTYLPVQTVKFYRLQTVPYAGMSVHSIGGAKAAKAPHPCLAAPHPVDLLSKLHAKLRDATQGPSVTPIDAGSTLRYSPCGMWSLARAAALR